MENEFAKINNYLELIEKNLLIYRTETGRKTLYPKDFVTFAKKEYNYIAIYNNLNFNDNNLKKVEFYLKELGEIEKKIEMTILGYEVCSDEILPIEDNPNENDKTIFNTHISFLKFLKDNTTELKVKMSKEYEFIKLEPIKETTFKESKLDLTERMLIIAFLQKHKLFPKHNSSIAQTQKDFDDFVSVLFNENNESIKKARPKTDLFFTPSKITKGQKIAKTKNLINIKPYFEILGNSEILEEIDTLLKEIDSN